jgi:hypothetical protein
MSRSFPPIAAALVAGAIALLSGAHSHASDRPWAEGVTKERQDKALALFTEGTAYLKDAYFKRAVDRYREALGLWDHPAIHFNTAKAMMNLDQPVEAHDHLDRAMRFGGAPLDAAQVAQIPELKAQLFANELAELNISLSEPAASLRVNGAEVARDAKAWKGLVRAGKTVVLATKDGFQPTQLSETFSAGTRPNVDLTLVKIDLNVRYYREMAVWKPWTVLGAGVLGVGAGVAFNLLGQKAYTAYDDSVLRCADVSPAAVENLGVGVSNDIYYACTPDSPGAALIDTESRDRGDLYKTLSIASYAVGGATLATGIALLYINREKVIDGAGTTAPVTFAPTLAPGRAGLDATIRF